MSEMIWQYDGAWARVPDPITWENGDDYLGVLCREGFTSADSWGWGSENTSIHEHKSGERWRVGLSIDSSGIHEIEVIGMPNLISLLRDLALISTASVLSLIGNELQDVIFNVAEDGRRERKRRFA